MTGGCGPRCKGALAADDPQWKPTGCSPHQSANTNVGVELDRKRLSSQMYSWVLALKPWLRYSGVTAPGALEGKGSGQYNDQGQWPRGQE